MKNIRSLIHSSFGRFSSLILKITVPLVFVQAAYLVYYIYSNGAFELMSDIDTFYAIVESVLISLLISVGGSLFMEYLEKKRP